MFRIISGACSCNRLGILALYLSLCPPLWSRNVTPMSRVKLSGALMFRHVQAPENDDIDKIYHGETGLAINIHKGGRVFRKIIPPPPFPLLLIMVQDCCENSLFFPPPPHRTKWTPQSRPLPPLRLGMSFSSRISKQFRTTHKGDIKIIKKYFNFIAAAIAPLSPFRGKLWRFKLRKIFQFIRGRYSERNNSPTTTTMAVSCTTQS